MKGLPKPDAVMLILDSTNLSRHLSLAAPILSLGLPTLVILNMADDLHGRGGEVDATELSKQLGTPVVLISASKGTGVEKVFEFLNGAPQHLPPKPPLLQLPVLQDVPKVRDWAANMSRRTNFRAPAPPLWTRRLDGIFLHPVVGSAGLLAGGDRRFPNHLCWRAPDDGRGGGGDSDLRQMDPGDACRIRRCAR